MYNFEDASRLTRADQTKLAELYKIQRAYKIEQQRIADGTAVEAIKPIDEVVGTKPSTYCANIGKTLSPRMAFLQDVGERAPSVAPPSRLGIDEDSFVTYVVVVPAACSIFPLYVHVDRRRRDRGVSHYLLQDGSGTPQKAQQVAKEWRRAWKFISGKCGSADGCDDSLNVTDSGS